MAAMVATSVAAFVLGSVVASSASWLRYEIRRWSRNIRIAAGYHAAQRAGRKAGHGRSEAITVVLTPEQQTVEYLLKNFATICK